MQPVSVIEMERYTSVEEYTQSVFQTLQEEMKNSPVLFIGVMPESSEGFEFVEHLLKRLHQNQWGPDVVVVDKDFGPEGFLPDATSVSVTREKFRLVEGLRNARKMNLRAMVVMPAPITPPWVAGSLTEDLRNSLGVEIMTLAISSFPRERDEEKQFPLACRTETHDRRGMGSLGCFVLSAARGLYRENLDPFRFYGSLDQMGEGNDFIGLLSSPRQEEAGP